jgi:phosphomannomutase
LAVAEKVNGTWTPFTGNEIGAMLGHWMWENWRKKNPSANAGDVYVVASTVSSKACMRARALNHQPRVCALT